MINASGANQPSQNLANVPLSLTNYFVLFRMFEFNGRHSFIIKSLDDNYSIQMIILYWDLCNTTFYILISEYVYIYMHITIHIYGSCVIWYKRIMLSFCVCVFASFTLVSFSRLSFLGWGGFQYKTLYPYIEIPVNEIKRAVKPSQVDDEISTW